MLDAIRHLGWRDFEQLIELILSRTGWLRISTGEKSREGIDLEAENIASSEKAFVQVKSSATQSVFDDYVDRFNTRREQYDRMFFAVHSSDDRLRAPANPGVHLWTADRLADLVVRTGLGEWVEHKLG